MRFTGLSVNFSFQIIQIAISDMKLAQILQSGFVFCFFHINKLNTGIVCHPTLLPRKPGSACKQNSKKHVLGFSRQQVRGSLSSFADSHECSGCEKLWTEAKPKPNKPAGFQFSRYMAMRSDKELCKHALSCVILGTGKKV